MSRKPVRGWRKFECHDCHESFEYPTRDCLSPSGETCPNDECRAHVSPYAHDEDPGIPVDSSGNITIPWDTRR